MPGGLILSVVSIGENEPDIARTAPTMPVDVGVAFINPWHEELER